MQQYLISEGYIRLVYTDEVTMLEKEVLAPKYSFDIFADNIEIVRYICSLMETGIEDKDFSIFKRDNEVVGKLTAEYEPYMLN